MLEQSLRFEYELESIVDFIALDSPVRALEFFHELDSKIQCIPHNPYIYRKRNKDENLRELIYKGYTIPFEIDTTNHKIVILGIFNQNLWN